MSNKHAGTPVPDEVDLVITMCDLTARDAALFQAALGAICGGMPVQHPDVLVALVALACWLDGPDPTRPGQSFAEQVRRAVPTEAWDQWLPIEASFRMGLLESAMRAADTDAAR